MVERRAGEVGYWRAGTTSTASVALQHIEGPTYIEGRCILLMFPDREQADRHYLERRSKVLSNENLTSVDKTAIGDQAYTASSSKGGHDHVARYVLVQKGRWIASICLDTTSGPANGDEPIVHAAEVQAATLP